MDEFSPSKTGKYGRRGPCKECRRLPEAKTRYEARQSCEKLAATGQVVKFCPRCEQVKPIELFSKGKNKDGRRSWCKTCAAQYYAENREQAARQWKARYAVRREEIIAYRKNYYIEHRAQENERNHQYYQNRRAAIAKWASQYRRENPHIKKASEHRRMARKRNLPDKFTAEDWQRALEYFGGKCAVCGYEPDEIRKLVPDHWIPIASPDCPGTVPTNIVPLCHGVGGCNNEKRDEVPLNWLIGKFGKSYAFMKNSQIEAFFSS